MVLQHKHTKNVLQLRVICPYYSSDCSYQSGKLLNHCHTLTQSFSDSDRLRLWFNASFNHFIAIQYKFKLVFQYIFSVIGILELFLSMFVTPILPINLKTITDCYLSKALLYLDAMNR